MATSLYGSKMVFVCFFGQPLTACRPPIAMVVSVEEISTHSNSLWSKFNCFQFAQVLRPEAWASSIPVFVLFPPPASLASSFCSNHPARRIRSLSPRAKSVSQGALEVNAYFPLENNLRSGEIFYRVLLLTGQALNF